MFKKRTFLETGWNTSEFSYAYTKKIFGLQRHLKTSISMCQWNLYICTELQYSFSFEDLCFWSLGGTTNFYIQIKSRNVANIMYLKHTEYISLSQSLSLITTFIVQKQLFVIWLFRYIIKMFLKVLIQEFVPVNFNVISVAWIISRCSPRILQHFSSHTRHSVCNLNSASISRIGVANTLSFM